MLTLLKIVRLSKRKNVALGWVKKLNKLVWLWSTPDQNQSAPPFSGVVINDSFLIPVARRRLVLMVKQWI